VGVPVGELEGESGENFPEVAPIFKVARAEEPLSEFPVRKVHLRKCLCDSRFPNSGETVEPEHWFIIFIRKHEKHLFLAYSSIMTTY